MNGCFNITGGDVRLNFRLINGSAKPANPKENDLWINTDTAITEYTFEAEEPKTPVEGMVWISTGADSEISFSAVKTKSIFVYPVGCRQYINGTWITKELQVYQNGEWRENILFVFNAGNTFDTLTGGWSSDGYSGGSGENTRAYISDTQIVCPSRSGTGSNTVGVIGTVNPIQTAGKDVLIAKGTVTGYNSSALYCIGLLAEKGNMANAAAKIELKESGAFEAQIDISAMSGLYYVFAGAAVLATTDVFDTQMAVDWIALQ